MGVTRPVRLALMGAGGRMGQAVREEVLLRHDLELIRLLGRPQAYTPHNVPSSAAQGTSPLEPLTREALETVDVLVDFSSESGLLETVPICRMTRTALVSGSTPLGPDAGHLLDELSLHVAVLHASNFSRGMAALLSVLPGLHDRLGPRFDAGVIDVHHRHKQDSPSGTARNLEAAWVRSPGALAPMASLRVGEATGDHALWIDGDGERIEIWHRAWDRRVFAQGALDAAVWIAGQKPGRYGLGELWAYP